MARLAAADDGGDAIDIQGAQMGIVDQGGTAVAAAGAIAMAGGASAIEIPQCLRGIGGADHRGGGWCLLRGGMEEKAAATTLAAKSATTSFFMTFPLP